MNTDSEKAKSEVKRLDTENTEVTEGTENSQRNYGRKVFVLRRTLPQPNSQDGVKSVRNANLLSFFYQCLSVFICGLNLHQLDRRSSERFR
jgi:hypothetical protein